MPNYQRERIAYSDHARVRMSKGRILEIEAELVLNDPSNDYPGTPGTPPNRRACDRQTESGRIRVVYEPQPDGTVFIVNVYVLEEG